MLSSSGGNTATSGVANWPRTGCDYFTARQASAKVQFSCETGVNKFWPAPTEFRL
ncbi:unnamed protein product [Protopolystoma xenopodis]|uniref:Uncharacterized protein n=1 Tax=Protopolystoma xenopodis TaxID=117903 RepID=A0A3S5B2E5_9PLAT|nr:unnamed protein product [Protopolystoma xenopodis]